METTKAGWLANRRFERKIAKKTKMRRNNEVDLERPGKMWNEEKGDLAQGSDSRL